MSDNGNGNGKGGKVIIRGLVLGSESEEGGETRQIPEYLLPAITDVDAKLVSAWNTLYEMDVQVEEFQSKLLSAQAERAKALEAAKSLNNELRLLAISAARAVGVDPDSKDQLWKVDLKSKTIVRVK